MDLNDFGTKCDGSPRQPPPQDNAFYHHERNFIPPESPTAPIQWKVSMPGVLTRAMELFRKIEPERPLVCMFEDIDAVIEIHGDSELLQWLDGTHQINKVINIATTNYPERLDRRIVSRPRRFDRIIKIESPGSRIREMYLAKKLPDLPPAELSKWVTITDGLSFAALAELVISVACLGNSLEDTVRVLRTLDDQHPSSREFDRPGTMGFNSPRGRRARAEDDVPY